MVLKEFWAVDVLLGPQNPQPVPDPAQLNFAIYPILDQTSEVPSTGLDVATPGVANAT